jgi:hypothetical protein
MGKPPKLPVTPELVDRDVEGFTRAWWQHRTLAESGLSLAQVVLEYQFAVCRYVVERIQNPLTPPEVRDAFAMRGLPNLGVVLKSDPGALAVVSSGAAGHVPAIAAAPEPAAPGPNVSSVLEAYRHQGKLPQ